MQYIKVEKGVMASRWLLGDVLLSVKPKGKNNLVAAPLLEVYDEICDLFGRAIGINSAMRQQNDSAHGVGMAFDLDIKGADMDLFLQDFSDVFPVLHGYGLRGIGFYETHLHVDVWGQEVKKEWELNGQYYPLRQWQIPESLGISPFKDFIPYVSPSAQPPSVPVFETGKADFDLRSFLGSRFVKQFLPIAVLAALTYIIYHVSKRR